jgi:hypothetical protein
MYVRRQFIRFLSCGEMECHTLLKRLPANILEDEPLENVD